MLEFTESDWEEMRRRVEEQDSLGNNKPLIDWDNLDKLDELDECLTYQDETDYNDEHGFLDPSLDNTNNIFYDEKTLSELAWNKKPQIKEDYNYLDFERFNIGTEQLDIKCRHFDEEQTGETYIFPINDNQRVCLCKYCNANLASKMLEQLALETFMAA